MYTEATECECIHIWYRNTNCALNNHVEAPCTQPSFSKHFEGWKLQQKTLLSSNSTQKRPMGTTWSRNFYIYVSRNGMWSWGQWGEQPLNLESISLQILFQSINAQTWRWWSLPSGEMIVMTYHALYPLAAVGTHIGILAWLSPPAKETHNSHSHGNQPTADIDLEIPFHWCTWRLFEHS